jgi:hypothetical protein
MADDAQKTEAIPAATGPTQAGPVLKNAPAAAAKGADSGKVAQGGAYEVLRARLSEQCALLRGKLDTLNARRKEVFGGLETTLIGSTRLTTENACLPRDFRHVGKKLVFGYTVFFGLKKETSVSDVFSVHEFDGQEFKSLGLGFLDDPRFVKDFTEIFQYYKNARISQIRNTGTLLLLVFQIGEKVTDIRVLRWALQQDGGVKYIDNRGDRDYLFPPQHDFEWTRTTRDQHIFGKHPHISIKDQLFVECVGGDLTLKIENNTETGKGIYSEPVQDPDQSLDDAEIHYAILENLILLKVRPFGEETVRHIVYSRLMQRARRVDAIGLACARLPEGHGVIFPGGYFLQTGECKEFSENTEGMEFLKVVRSLNGEDILYVFYHRVEGRYILLQYNVVKKEAAAPITCHGYSIYPDGKLLVFKTANNETSRSHPVQIWQTPFVGEGFAQTQNTSDYLGKIGNKDLVNGISDAMTLAKLAQDSIPSAAAYENLVKQTESLLDRYHWLAREECQNLAGTVKSIRDTGNAIIDEFEKVVRIRKNTSDQIEKFAAELEQFFTKLRPDLLRTIDEHVAALAEMRRRRGQLISLRELRYSDLPRLQTLEERLTKHYDDISKRTVAYLLGPDALAPYGQKLDEMLARIEALQKATDAAVMQEELDALGAGLDLLAEIINNLKIDDATARTAIIEALSSVYSHLNRVKAQLAARRKALLGSESVAEFGAQFKLLGQGLASCIGLCDTPEKCDEFLGKLLIQVEELESRFSDFPEFSGKIADKRDEAFNAFSTRKQSLLDERQRKASALLAAADRVLKSIVRRAQSFTSADEMNGFFAADAMALKIGDISEKLRDLGDSVKSDELASRLKSTREEAMRTLRDKIDIFEDGANVLKFGKHRFNVNSEPLDVSLVLRDGVMFYHITGTDYFEQVADERFLKTRELWDQELPSENDHVCRAEFLAWKMLTDAEAGHNGLTLAKLQDAAAPKAAPSLEDMIRAYASELYDEGYSRGIHDHDAAALLRALLQLHDQCGLLRFDPLSRACACLFWSRLTDETARDLLLRKARNFGRMQRVFNSGSACADFISQIAAAIEQFCDKSLVDFLSAHAGRQTRAAICHTAANYLHSELALENSSGFAVSQSAVERRAQFLAFLKEHNALDKFNADLKALDADVSHGIQIACEWLNRFFAANSDSMADVALPEVLSLLLTAERLKTSAVSTSTSARVTGLLGQHKRIEQQTLTLRLDEFLSRVSAFASEVAPRFREYQALRKELLDAERARLRLEEFKPKTMTSFVRNKLINDVYLPLIGENLAKQMGEAGSKKRTDLMGMLLLISPPGYGKTTILEYVASRLGVSFMKINGPALGTGVVSVDPAEAPNATAREEVEKLNLSFEMGNNVMIYVDDIQHTNPEFLQKFISLCDAQRKIEGVYKGRSRTYDFRGKKVAVVMAGNPYTESGARFQIPDMLANRADTYNLGDIIGGRRDLFELSYLENCLTSNSTLSPLAARGVDDFYKLVKMADGEQVGETELGGNYSASELKDLIAVIRKLRAVQRVVLRVNMEYISSASQKDEYRTEPPFKLQGSYRNMNKIAAKVQPVLTDTELDNIIADHYRGEAQALASGTEHNLLKLAEILGRQSAKEKERWEEIKRVFNRSQSMLGADKDDKVALVVSQLASFNDQLGRIHSAIMQASAAPETKGIPPALLESIEKLAAILHQSNTAQGAHLAESLQLLAGKLAAGNTLEYTAPKIEVVNTLPAYYTNLYKHHIEVIQGVLVPLVKGINHQMKTDENLHQMLSAVAANMEALTTELDHQDRRHGKGTRVDPDEAPA